MNPLSPSWLAAGALLLAFAASPARSAETLDRMPIARPGELRWVPKETLPPGAFAAVAQGDPHHGPYAFYGRFPVGFRVPPHWHTNDVGVVVLEGEMTIERDGSPARTIAPAESFLLPAALPYTALCPEGCLFLAWGREPFDIHYLRAEDDPRRGDAK